jgi:uncharacterized damage-inducible protein DinB
MPRKDLSIELLLDAIDEAFDSKSWHGTNLRGSLRSLGAEDAAWRPGPGRHSIQEIAVHAAYWKYAVRRALTGGKRGSFPLKGSNWFGRDGADEAQWRADLNLLVEEHRQLRTAVLEFDPARLGDQTPKRTFTYAAVIRGVAAHDLYHAGQIQLLKRLRRGAD